MPTSQPRHSSHDDRFLTDIGVTRTLELTPGWLVDELGGPVPTV
ncbi:MAG: hypothetical protein WBG14_15080 [Rhodococcus sp. (in: high G+C Gram-positive bacteria)]